MRGRVISIYMVCFRGGMPLGALASGYAASIVPAPTVLIVNGVLLTCIAGYVLVFGRGIREPY
jgi:hypothetical protein